MSDPSAPFPTSFSDLDALRTRLSVLARRHIPSLQYYYDDSLPGFHHTHDRPTRVRIPTASTSTCLLSIIKTEKWTPNQPWAKTAPKIVSKLLQQEWRSGGLDVDNPFSTSFVVETVTALEAVLGLSDLAPADRDRLNHGEKLLLDSVASGSVSLTVENKSYPPSAYLTQLVARVLKARDVLTSEMRSAIAQWAWREIDHQLALSLAKSKNTDHFQLVYSIMLAADIGDLQEATPDQNLILQAALDTFFAEQLPDATWPRSRPLFHYPGTGNAYCYEYEMLTQLLQTTSLRDRLLRYFPEFRDAAFALETSGYPLAEDGVGWSSGHHPQFHGPKSWSTASAYHFAYNLDRLVAEAMRKVLFEDLRVPYTPPGRPRTTYEEFAPDLLDSTFSYGGQEHSLKRVLFDTFIQPIASEARRVEAGGPMSPETPTSAILFGPPGTSKTELSSQIAEFLRWPRLSVDPSYFVRNGMDRMQSQAEILFNELAASERIVVLLDEFDEMVRDRKKSNEILSRFLTTSMLPKLAVVNKWRRLVFIVATNHIEEFDIAITRRGRFDLIVPVMPPTLEQKWIKWPAIKNKIESLQLDVDHEITQKLTRLTYDEFRVLARTIEAADNDKHKVWQLVNGFGCTLDQPMEAGGDQTWAQACENSARSRTLLPTISLAPSG